MRMLPVLDEDIGMLVDAVGSFRRASRKDNDTYLSTDASKYLIDSADLYGGRQDAALPLLDKYAHRRDDASIIDRHQKEVQQDMKYMLAEKQLPRYEHQGLLGLYKN